MASKKTKISIWWLHSEHGARRAPMMHQGLTKLCFSRRWEHLDVKLTSVPHHLWGDVWIQSDPLINAPTHLQQSGSAFIILWKSLTEAWTVMISLCEEVKSRASHAGGSWAILVRVCVRIKEAPGWRYVQLCADIVCLCVFLLVLPVLWKHLADMQSCADLLSNVHRSSVPVHYVIMFYLETVLFKNHALDCISLTF